MSGEKGIEGVDKGMEHLLPKSVLDQVEKAEAIAAQSEADKGKTAEPAAPEAKADESQAAAPATGEGTKTATEDQAKHGGEDELAKLRHQMSVLQGKYNAEVPRLHEQLRVAYARIAEQDARLSLQSTPVATQKGVATPGELSLLDESKYEDYDEGTQGLVKTINALVAKLSEQKGMADRVSRIESVTAKSAAESYNGRLTKLCPEWEALNSDAGFLEWLEGRELSGHKRIDIIRHYDSAGDADSVATVFNTYLGLSSKPPAKGGGNGDGKPPRGDLGRETVPSGAGNGDGGRGQQKQSPVTRLQLREAADAFQKGRLTQAEYDKIADQFQQALGKGQTV